MTWEEGFLRGMMGEARKQRHALARVLVRARGCGRVGEGIRLTIDWLRVGCNLDQ